MNSSARSACALLAATFLLAGCTLGQSPGRDAEPSTGPGRPSEVVEGTREYRILENTHSREDLDYPQTPPAGGRHAPVWVPCGSYREPVKDEEAVHTLEHGAVWVTYLPGLAPKEVRYLERLARSGAKVLVSPHPDQSSPVVLTSWGRQLELDGVDDPRLAQFLEEFTDSPNSPEPGVTCEAPQEEPTRSPLGEPPVQL